MEIEQNDLRYNTLREIFTVRKAIQLEAKSITVRTPITIRKLSDLKIKIKKYPISSN